MITRWLWFLSVLLGIFLFSFGLSVPIVIVVLLFYWFFRKTESVAVYIRIVLFGIVLSLLSSYLHNLDSPILGDSCYGYVSDEFASGYAVDVLKCDTSNVSRGEVYVNCYGRGCPGMYTKVYVKINSVDSFGSFSASGKLIRKGSLSNVPLVKELELKILSLGNKYKIDFYNELLKNSNKEIASLGASIIVGETEFPKDLKDIVLDLGLLHIVAISGVNILYLQKLVEVLTRDQGIKVKRVIGLVVMVLLWFFVGNEFSLVRAMASVIWNVMIGEMGITKNKFDFLIIFTVLLVSYVGLVENISFWLVFGACIGIYAVSPSINKLLNIKNDLVNEFVSGVVVWGSVTPVVWYFFSRIQPWSILTSFILSPIVEIITMYGYIVFSLYRLPILGDVLLYLYALLVSLFYNLTIMFHGS